MWVDFGHLAVAINQSGSHAKGNVIQFFQEYFALQGKNLKFPELVKSIGDYINLNVIKKVDFTKTKKESLSVEPNIIFKRAHKNFYSPLISYYTDIRKLTNQGVIFKNLYQVHFSFPDNPQNEYWGLGFKNKDGGFEVRTRDKQYYVPVNNSEKTFSLIKGKEQNSDSLIVFEGFFDYLTYLHVKRIDALSSDVVVLNHALFANKILSTIEKKGYKTLHFFGDNDGRGEQSLRMLKESNIEIKDHRKMYKGVKDLNDWWVDKMEKNHSIKHE